MKVTIKRWHGVATWHWGVDEECCGICRYTFEACCPDCTLPGDGCPPGRLEQWTFLACECIPTSLMLVVSLGSLQPRLSHALPHEVARVAAVVETALSHVPPRVAVPKLRCVQGSSATPSKLTTSFI